VNDGAGMASNRVDIGVFVHNGVYYSPPAFITFYSLDSEARTYRKDGQPLEIGYDVGSSRVSVADWTAFFNTIQDGFSWPGNFLTNQFTPKEIAILNRASRKYQKIRTGGAPAEEAQRILEEKIPQLGTSISEFVHKVLTSLMRDPYLLSANEKEIRVLMASSDRDAVQAFESIRESLLVHGVAVETGNALIRLEPLRSGTAPLTVRLTKYEKSLVEQINMVLLSRILFPDIVIGDWRRNFVDPRIATVKQWRDVYQYTADGELTGWRRYRKEGILEFNAEGLLVVKKDRQGRCLKGRVVRYETEPAGLDAKSLPDILQYRRVRMVPTDVVREY
jgi:hypothetical protein